MEIQHKSLARPADQSADKIAGETPDLSTLFSTHDSKGAEIWQARSGYLDPDEESHAFRGNRLSRNSRRSGQSDGFASFFRETIKWLFDPRTNSRITR